ncbi:MAG: plastocyanin/azurin family copper-binding protein, partial [Planctomycetota bacterium]
AFHALTPKYPDLNPKPAGLDAYSGTCGADFVDMASFPADLHGGFVKARYKPTNKIEYHEWNEELGHYDENRTFDIIFSKNLSFIPVDIRFGPRGALYVCDWYNPVKGHSQYSLRDSRRDRRSGRIWRITAKGMPLIESPKIGQQSVPELLETLKRPETRIRYWARRELRERDPNEVRAALDRFVANLNPSDPRYRHHQVEALWMYRGIDQSNLDLLKELLNCEGRHARAAATRQLRYFHDQIPNATALLKQRANDENGLVRLEAAIAASYYGTPRAIVAAADVLNHPRDGHIDYALYTALNSHTLKPLWEDNADIAAKLPALNQFFNGFGKEIGMKEEIITSSEAAFDTQGNVLVVEIGTIPERMMYDVREIRAKAGQPIKIILKNPDATPHNLVITKPGEGDKVGMLATEMAKDPVAAAKGEFIPETDAILWKTKMIGEGQVDVLRFMAPKKPGQYPYVCTFPGHWVLMRGVLIVE